MNQEGCVGVAKVVEPQLRQAVGFADRLEAT